MRRLLTIFALMVVAFIALHLIGCTTNQADSPSVEDNTTNDSSVSYNEISKSNDTVVPKPVKIDNSNRVTTDDYDLTFTGFGIADKVYPNMDTVGNSTFAYFDDVEDHSYIVVSFEFHNKMNTFYVFNSPLKTCNQSLRIFKDGQFYDYFSDIYDPEQHGLFTSAICYNIPPLDTRAFCMVFDVPDDALDKDPNCWLYWKFYRLIIDGDQYTISDELLGNYENHFGLNLDYKQNDVSLPFKKGK